MILGIHQNSKNLFLTSEARLAYFGIAPPASPGGNTPSQTTAPEPAPQEATRPLEVQPPPSAPTVETLAEVQIEPMRQEGLHMIFAAERLNEQQQISTLKNSAEELFREIEERLLIPINGTERDQFEQKKRLALEGIEHNSSLLIGWRLEHPNIRIQPPPGQSLDVIYLSDRPAEERFDQLMEYVNAFEISGGDISEGDKDRFKRILSGYLGAITPMVEDILKIERKEAIAQLPDNLRQAFQRLQADPTYASLLFDSHRSLERFPQEARGAIRRYRELRARAEARSGSPVAAIATAEGTAGTPRTRSPESSEGRSWDKFKEFIKEILEMLVGYEMAKQTGDISHIRGGPRRQETPPAPPAPTPEGPPTLGEIGPLFNQDLSSLSIVENAPGNSVVVTSSGRFNIQAPINGKIESISQLQDGRQSIVFMDGATPETSKFLIHFIVPRGTRTAQIPEGSGMGLSKGNVIASQINRVEIKILRLEGIGTARSQRLEGPQRVMELLGLRAPSANPEMTPGEPQVPVAVGQESRGERTPNSPPERQAEARRTYETLKTLAEEAKNLQGSDICRVSINALVNADSGSLEALWRRFPRNPNQQTYETFQREVTNLRAKLQAWKEYPELARRAQANRVVLQQAGPESSDEAGNTARQNIITVVEALKNALQALSQTVAAQTPQPRPNVETGMPDTPPATPPQRRWEIEHRVTGIDGLRSAARSNRSVVAMGYIDNIFQGLQGELERFPRNPTQEAYEAFLVKINNAQRQLLAWRDLPELLASVQRLDRPSPAGIENLEANTDAGNQARANIVTLVDTLRSTINSPATVATSLDSSAPAPPTVTTPPVAQAPQS